MGVTGASPALAFDAGVAIGPQVYAALRRRIVTAALRPGEIISETEIARAFSVSRQPVREAFIKLSEAGLVRILPQRGTMVSRVDAAQVMQSRFVREAIETSVVRAAAVRQDATAGAELTGQVAAQRRLSDGDHDGFMKLDDLFHRTLAEAAGVPYAWSVVEEIKAQMDRVRYLSVERAHVRHLIGQHEAVADAVTRGEPDAAERAMRDHLNEILRSLPLVAEAHPELFVPN